MKSRFLASVFPLFCAIFLFCGVAFAQSPAPAFDWSWSFTKVTDGSGNVLAEYNGTTPTSDPLSFSVSPTIDKVIFNATVYMNQGLNDTNITFGGSALNMGASFSSPYWSEIFATDYRGFSPPSYGYNHANDIWLFHIGPGSYEVIPYVSVERITSALPAGVYKLGNTDPNAPDSYIEFFPYGELALPSVYGENWREYWYDEGSRNYATNYVQWTVNGSSGTVPEPTSLLLLGLGLMGLAGVGRKIKK